MTIKDNTAFCILPWISAYVQPDGKTYPCCIAENNSPWGDVKQNTLNNIINNETFRQARLDMLANKKVSMCNECYQSESMFNHSARISYNDEFGKHITESLQKTDKDGYIEPRLRYIDIRFSNICNMKCRMCNPGCSSLWGQEEKQRIDSFTTPVLHASDKNSNLLDQILQHLPYVQTVYFAGGEPLIMEEHYVILEELIRLGKSKNVHLRYNTNLSVLTYKKRELFNLWQNFKSIDLSASLDHYGERAEYIRHGVNWANIESNIKKIKTLDNVFFNVSSTISIFNFVTWSDFYTYMTDNALVNKKDIDVFPLNNPEYLNCQVLPKNIKAQGIKNLIKCWPKQSVRELINFSNQLNSWDKHKDELRKEILLRDKIRNEDFCKTFPELKEILND